MSSIVSGITPSGAVVGPGLVGFDKVRAQYFERLNEEIPSVLATGYTAVDAVDTVDQVVVTLGNWTLTVTIGKDRERGRFHDQSFTTANIAHNANAATIQGAIDTAATAAGVIGWTNADIVVTGGNLAGADIVFTYSGASVSGLRHGALAVDSGTLDGVLVVATTTTGQKALGAVQLLLTRGPMTGTDPVDPSTWVRNPSIKTPSRPVLDAYAWLVNDELTSDTAGSTILAAFGY